MAFRTITAKYRGNCYRCGGVIDPGDRIRFGNRRTYHLLEDCPGADEADSPYAADRYASVSITRNADGDVIDFRNRWGRCEDAPCCGCCGPY